MNPVSAEDQGRTGVQPESEPQTGRVSRPRRSGLGRGLGALIPETGAAEGADRPTEIPVGTIEANPYQPRLEIGDAELEELVASVEVHGVIQPLIVTPASSGRYTLVAGERRWRAAQRAGLTTVPVVIRSVSQKQMLELAIVENLIRSDLTALEEAQAYRRLIEEFALTQSQVAERVGKSRATVANTLRLLLAPRQVLEALQTGTITEGHARALLSLPSAADQVAMLENAVSRSWSVRETEAAVRTWLARGVNAVGDAQESSALPSADDQRISRALEQALGTGVAVKRKGRKGSGAVIIEFSSDDQLFELVDRIAGRDEF